MPEVAVSATFARQFKRLQKKDKERLRRALGRLAEDPLTPRPGADILALEGTSPPKHRIRVGDHRIVYLVDGDLVRVIEVFRRGRGYRE